MNSPSPIRRERVAEGRVRGWFRSLRCAVSRGILLLAALVPLRTEPQTVLFDFDNAPVHTSLPLNLTVGGITASLSSTGQGLSIQPANSLGFTPSGFAGNCLYPNSVYAADLLISFSTTLTDFSILYAPEEYACDSSATMRVTAYLNGTAVGSNTTNAQAGTWPSETLRIGVPQGFNRVAVHYDAPPATGGDWGPIFMADNMTVTPAAPPIVLDRATLLSTGAFQFEFANRPSVSFSVFARTNASQPSSGWIELGAATEIGPGLYRFIDSGATNHSERFYYVNAP